MSTVALPSHASVVVIGGGVMGCSVLYHLAKEGVGDAVLLERHKISSGTTWHSAAQVRALRASKNMTRLIRHSIDLYVNLEKETGQSTGWQNTGSLSIATTPDRLTHLRRQEQLAAAHGVQAFPISRGEAKERWPLMYADDIIGATWSPDDGRVGPTDLCAALVKGAQARGAKTLENTPVTGLLTARGKISGVQTAAGTIRCDAVVLCAGLWSRDIASNANTAAPLWPCEHFYLLTMPLDGVRRAMPTLSDHDKHLYIRDDSGGLLVGCFEPYAKAIHPHQLGEDFAFQLLPDDWEHFAPMMENAIHRVPQLATAQAKTLVNGPESFTPDGMFLLGETTETEGLFLACGMNSVGVASAGGAGFVLARQIVTGQAPLALPEASPGRFDACWNCAKALAVRAPEVLGRHYEIAYPHRQMTSARPLRLLPLHATWQKHNAVFGQFNGWERPLYFNPTANKKPAADCFGRPAWHEQVGKEVMQAHNHAAVFDISTLGKISVSGKDAEKFLNKLLTNDMTRPPKRASYTAMLNDGGGIVSALSVLRLDQDHYRLCTGTSAVGSDLRHLKKHAGGWEVTLADETEQWAMLALCGASAPDVANKAGANIDDLLNLPRFAHTTTTIGGQEVLAARLSYTGELGWEITCHAQHVTDVFAALKAAGAAPAGMFAQNSMRLEKKFLSYGHDADADLSPIEAGLEFVVDWTSPFIGKAALQQRKQQGEAARIAVILLEDDQAMPLGGEPVYEDKILIGQTTSAAFGYRLQKPVALVLLNTGINASNPRRVTINIASKPFIGHMIPDAPFDPAGKRLAKPPKNLS